MAGSSLGLNRSRQGNNCIKSAANRPGIEQERGLSVFTQKLRCLKQLQK